MRHFDKHILLDENRILAVSWGKLINHVSPVMSFMTIIQITRWLSNEFCIQPFLSLSFDSVYHYVIARYNQTVVCGMRCLTGPKKSRSLFKHYDRHLILFYPDQLKKKSNSLSPPPLSLSPFFSFLLPSSDYREVRYVRYKKEEKEKRKKRSARESAVST